MRVAYYAPLKSPYHPVPSGDRRMARLFVDALRLAGHDVELASTFRSLDIAGDRHRQHRLQALAGRLAERYLRQAKRVPPDLWFTYHLYHRAPDWLGPVVADRLGVPYLVAEASYAPKRAGGNWASGHEAVARALRRADQVICLNPDDAACIRPLLADDSRLTMMRPFLDAGPPRRARAERARHRRRLARRLSIDPAVPWIAVTAMMRPGDKLASYRLLARALHGLADRAWVLLVAGGGDARREVTAALDFDERVRFLGILEQDDVDALHAAADLGVWPAVNEAYGMALLEAQAAGLPLVVGDRPGVRELVAGGDTAYIVRSAEAGAFSAAIAGLLADPRLRKAMSDAAVRRVESEHDLPSAARRLDAIIREAARPAVPGSVR